MTSTSPAAPSPFFAGPPSSGPPSPVCRPLCPPPRRMATEDTTKSASELRDEQRVLSEIMRTVERRDALVAALEEQRLRERAEDRDLESLVLSRGYEFHWAPAAAADDSWGAGGEGGV